jgi:hypothetical protein
MGCLILFSVPRPVCGGGKAAAEEENDDDDDDDYEW